ncbi:CPBP family intramembrane glutamic endopeptidase [Microbacterium sp. NPDC086615]|uniref:CPBP family intramembrane glutamic endopeptidase n=1 Tax=Microbacterium sp. NPDC086615 TaxID=3154865 RepID=UPI003449A6BF
MLTIVMIGLVLSACAARLLMPIAGFGFPSTQLFVTWACLLLLIVLGLLRRVPSPLLLCRTTDLLWGVGLGLALRILQGFLSGANSSPFPDLRVVGGANQFTEAAVAVLGSVLVAPVLEEGVFRGLALVSCYVYLRRRVGGVPAAIASALISSALFVLMHTSGGSSGIESALQLLILAVTLCGLVFATGRIWGSIFAHVTYNATFSVLMIVGSIANG